MSNSHVKWTNIAASVRAAIERGELPVGSRLPKETDMAEQWGVSAMTVQRAMQELQREGWVLRKRKAGTVVAERAVPSRNRIALVFTNLAMNPQSSYVQGVRDALPENFTLIPYDTQHKAQLERGFLEQIVARDEADGLIVYATGVAENTPRLIEAAMQLPTVFVDRVPTGLLDSGVPIDAVMSDNSASIKNGLGLLYSRGHREIAYFMEDSLTISSVSERFTGYKEFMIEHGNANFQPLVCNVSPTLPVETYFARVESNLRELLSGDRPITAVCCQQSKLMAAVLEACVNLRVAVPEQLEVLAFGSPDSAFLPLGRSVHRLEQRAVELGSMALRRLQMRLQNPSLPSQIMRLEADLYVASTNGPRPHPEGYLGGKSLAEQLA